ncbi:unnamed protein product [Effrenium voratum]|uniref:Uncharacterized protein n=1 Tax=Effrenium voratum TaxID=2562239 RepID=A0AA36II00_9DINO|nr:unnamed protein product [Effrenium voratum]
MRWLACVFVALAAFKGGADELSTDASLPTINVKYDFPVKDLSGGGPRAAAQKGGGLKTILAPCGHCSCFPAAFAFRARAARLLDAVDAASEDSGKVGAAEAVVLEDVGLVGNLCSVVSVGLSACPQVASRLKTRA